MKYLVDKYNLLYAYKPLSASGQQHLHSFATKIVIVGVVHVQVATMFFSIVRSGTLPPLLPPFLPSSSTHRQRP